MKRLFIGIVIVLAGLSIGQASGVQPHNMLDWYAGYPDCMAGPVHPAPAECLTGPSVWDNYDTDGDGHVDLYDYAVIQDAWPDWYGDQR